MNYGCKIEKRLIVLRLYSYNNRLMNKTILSNTQLTNSRVIQSKNQSECKISSREECSTQNSDQVLSLGDTSILEEQSVNSKSQLQYNFKKAKDRQNSLASPPIISSLQFQQKRRHQTTQVKTKESLGGFYSEIAELEAIERRTQQLAIKQKQQRRQLKKLKKVLLERQSTIKQQQFGFQVQKTNLNNRINQLQTSESILSDQKEVIEKRLRELQVQLHQTKQQSNKYKQQKEKLLRKLQHLEANIDDSVQNQQGTNRQQKKDRMGQLVQEIMQVDEVQSQLAIIDSEIDKLKKMAKNQQNYGRLLSYFELKNNYLQKREELRINKSNKRYQNIIFKLNRVIINRNADLDNCLPKSEDVVSENKQEKLLETAESFFSKNQTARQLNQDIETFAAVNGVAELKQQLFQKINTIIEANTLKQYEDLYECISRMSMILLSARLDSESEESYLQSFQKNIESINKYLTTKSLNKCEKIQRLMCFIGGELRSKTSSKQQK